MHARKIINYINIYYILSNFMLRNYNNLVINYKLKCQNRNTNDILNIKFK